MTDQNYTKIGIDIPSELAEFFVRLFRACAEHTPSIKLGDLRSHADDERENVHVSLRQCSENPECALVYVTSGFADDADDNQLEHMTLERFVRTITPIDVLPVDEMFRINDRARFMAARGFKCPIEQVNEQTMRGKGAQEDEELGKKCRDIVAFVYNFAFNICTHPSKAVIQLWHDFLMYKKNGNNTMFTLEPLMASNSRAINVEPYMPYFEKSIVSNIPFWQYVISDYLRRLDKIQPHLVTDSSVDSLRTRLKNQLLLKN